MKKRLQKLTMLMFSKKAYDRARSVYRVALLGTSITAFAIVPAFAADPLAAINSLSDFIFSIIKAVGLLRAGVLSSSVCRCKAMTRPSAHRASFVCWAAC